jgi:hypothetical protein
MRLLNIHIQPMVDGVVLLKPALWGRYNGATGLSVWFFWTFVMLQVENIEKKYKLGAKHIEIERYMYTVWHYLQIPVRVTFVHCRYCQIHHFTRRQLGWQSSTKLIICSSITSNFDPFKKQHWSKCEQGFCSFLWTRLVFTYHLLWWTEE